MGGSDFDLEASGGNGIFGCGDRTPKIAAEALGHLQRPKSAKRKAGNPRRKRPVSVVLETRGLQSSNQSPPPSQERNFSMQRRRVEIRLFCLQRLTRRRGRTRKARYSRYLKTAWWRMQSSETGLHRKNREFFENCRPKQDSRVRIPAGRSKFARVANHLGRHLGTFLLFRKTGC